MVGSVNAFNFSDGVDGLLGGVAIIVLLPLLALERARRMRGAAAIAIGGVVASLSLAVALTVMVASFRGSVLQWLDAVLPAPLYLRSALYAAGGDAALLPSTLARDVARLPGVAQVEPLRASPLQLDAARPALTLLARPLGNAPARRLRPPGPARRPSATTTTTY